ncbi:MAG: ATP-dependent Clp protease ATP-binding subunit [Rhodospirillales bacterium]|nr:ATP-dependent Clp protease ATP-binding subunit [Rhodospirillales bacterium]MCB9994898.1 ATP-dependent Clp protease ATP-binding subunit [Rhodospirillales bacterium]
MSNVEATTNDYLVRGSDYLAAHPDFELKGRQEPLNRLIKTLTRKSANNPLLVGPAGVGNSALCLGLQAKKNDPDAPYDLVRKRFFWLDTDGLFASGNPTDINEAFQKALATLSRDPDTVLVIDDMRDFVDAAQSNGSSNLINALMRGVKQGKFQAILETDDDDIDAVLKSHSDLYDQFTMLDTAQPEGEELAEIIAYKAKILEAHHKIKVSQEAIDAAIELTTKYRVRDMGLSRAQPERAITLLDRALTTYRLEAHTNSPVLKELEERLESVTATLEDPSYSEEQGGKSISELETLKVSLETDIAEETAKWDQHRKQVRMIYKDLRLADERIRQFEDEKAEILKKEEAARIERIKQMEERGEDLKEIEQAKMGLGGLQSPAVSKLNQDIAKYRAASDDSKAKFEALMSEINEDLELGKEHVFSEFSDISGVPVSKLTENEKAKLKNLERNLGGRVWGQDQAVTALSNEVIIAKAGLQDPDKPQGAFLYMGPSGVGKTELAKALAHELLDDEKALLRFDMSEYMEKHAVAKLIGSPPGYEGYEAGGILTNEMRRNPRRIILLDEIEKAHPDILLLMLQVLDDARLTDNRGLTVSFRDAYVIMTSNVGKEYFVDPNLTFEEAQAKAIEDLEKKLPPELLNRLNGRQNIICFDKLNLPVIEKIADREINKLNKMVRHKNPKLSVDISDGELKEMCEDHYIPVQGARGIKGYIQSKVKPEIAKTVLFEEAAEGVMNITYKKEPGSAQGTGTVTVHAPKIAGELAAESANKVAPGTASSEFNNQPM